MLKTVFIKAGVHFLRLKRRGEFFFYSLPAGPRALGRRPGQSTIEYLLMLGVVAVTATVMAMLFYKKILGGIFTLVGIIIGAENPK